MSKSHFKFMVKHFEKRDKKYPPLKKIEKTNETKQKERMVVQKVIVKVRCPYCHKIYDETLNTCPYCGGSR